MDTEDPKRIKRLVAAIDASHKKLEKPRKERLASLKQYLGSHYGEGGAKDKVPCNLLEVAVNTYVTHLAATRPRVMVTSRQRELRPNAYSLELTIDRYADDSRIEDKLRRAVQDSMFRMGIAKVGTKPGQTVKIRLPGVETTITIPEIFVDWVDFGDWVHDCCAHTEQDASFLGNRYRMPLDQAKEAEWFDKKIRQELKSSHEDKYESNGDEKTSSLSGDPEEDGEYEEYVELWDIWLPGEQTLVTMPVGKEDVLCRRKLSRSPFHILGYYDVPNNFLPKPPISDWIDLHELVNRLLRKLGRQAERQKTITVVRSGAEQDGKRVIDASDGDTITSDDPSSTREMRYGGIDNATFAFFLQAKDLFSWSAGNLDVLAGLGAGADTATEANLLQQANSFRVQHMQKRAQDFYRGVFTHVAEEIWHNKFYRPTVFKGEAPFEVASRFENQGSMSDYGITVEPYSAQTQTPTYKLAALNEVMGTLMQMMQQIQTEGGSVNVKKFIKEQGRLRGMENEFDELVTFSGEPAPQATERGDIGKPAVTERRYVRKGQSGMTRAGADRQLVQNLMSKANNGANA